MAILISILSENEIDLNLISLLAVYWILNRN